MPKIIHTFPPNIAAIVKVFPMATNSGTIFAFGEFIYVPSGKELPPELMAHELVHCERQLKQGVDEWWAQYLVDPDFRYHEELLAHRAEYLKLCELYPTRHQRRYFLQHVAKKLAARLYGKMVTIQRASEDIRNV